MILRGKFFVVCIGFFLNFGTVAFALAPELNIEELVYKKVKERLIADYPEMITASIKIKITNSNIYKQLPAGAWSLDLELPDKAKLLGRTVQDLRVYDKVGKPLGKINTYISTEGQGIIFKAKHLIRKRTIIKADDIEYVQESLIAQPVHRVRAA